MILQRKDIELLAPASSFETLHAAIQGGANAVYFGVGSLNMRSRSATGFTIDDFPEITRICQEHGVRTFLTLNTVIYDEDFPEMESTALAAKNSGIDAAIVSDMAAVAFAQKIGLTAHGSTQLNISNIQAVEFFAKFFDVMVLARELKLSQVKDITRQIEEKNILGPSGHPVKIEVFAHGALCMAISGKCYLSLQLHDRSANRGACLQPCRRGYEVTEKEQGYNLEIDNQYIMSPKDLCTIDFLDQVLDAGVKVLKIEGRGRQADYVKRVSGCYNEAINAVCDGTFNSEKVAEWKARLAEVYNRGFWDGYYLGRPLGEWSDVHGSKATKKKVFVGIVLNYFNQAGVAKIKLQADTLSIGDEILITGATSGVVETKIEELRDDNDKIAEGAKGSEVFLKTPELVRRNDKIYKLMDN